MMASITFKWDSSELDANLAALPAKVKERIRGRVRTAAKRGETQMKIKAPWDDRTGAARAGLYARATTETIAGSVTRYGIEFGNACDHGIWLEIAMSGRYQIIMPTLKATGDALMMSMTDLLGRASDAGEVAEFSPELGERGTSQGVQVRAGRYAFKLKRATRENVRRAIRRRGGF